MITLEGPQCIVDKSSKKIQGRVLSLYANASISGTFGRPTPSLTYWSIICELFFAVQLDLYFISFKQICRLAKPACNGFKWVGGSWPYNYPLKTIGIPLGAEARRLGVKSQWRCTQLKQKLHDNILQLRSRKGCFCLAKGENAFRLFSWAA